jgi:nucleotide-binding universal stress UspA family protein
VRLEWRARSTLAPLADQLAHEARSADLIVVGSEPGDAAPDPTREVGLRDLVMAAGRPVLVVPPDAAERRLERVLVGWKDTREAQRAVADALPLLARARTVTLAGIAAREELGPLGEQLSEVAAWLALHTVRAETVTRAARATHAAELSALASELGADLLVVGAYGHSRQRDWVLGGVTSDLLEHRQGRCTLLSH